MSRSEITHIIGTPPAPSDHARSLFVVRAEGLRDAVHPRSSGSCQCGSARPQERFSVRAEKRDGTSTVDLCHAAWCFGHVALTNMCVCLMVQNFATAVRVSAYVCDLLLRKKHWSFALGGSEGAASFALLFGFRVLNKRTCLSSHRISLARLNMPPRCLRERCVCLCVLY